MTCLRATTLFCLYFDCKDSGIFEYAGYKNCFLGCKFYFYSVNKTTSNTSFLFFTPIQIPFFIVSVHLLPQTRHGHRGL